MDINELKKKHIQTDGLAQWDACELRNAMTGEKLCPLHIVEKAHKKTKK